MTVAVTSLRMEKRWFEKRAKPPRYSHTVSGAKEVTSAYSRRSNFLPPT